MQVPKFKNIEEELEYYRTGMLFWRTHAMNLEEQKSNKGFAQRNTFYYNIVLLISLILYSKVYL